MSDAFAHLSLVLIFVAGLQRQHRQVVPARLPQRLLDQLAAGGVIICSGHVGLWEAVPFVVAPALPPAVRAASIVVYQPLHWRWADAWLLGRRRLSGIGLVPARGSWPRLLAALEGGGVVGIVGDQRPRATAPSVSLRFLGTNARFEDGIGRLHAASRAPVWFAAVVHEPAGRFAPRAMRVIWTELAPPLAARQLSTAQCVVQTVMERYADALDMTIRQVPGQYMWMHNRWRRLSHPARSLSKWY